MIPIRQGEGVRGGKWQYFISRDQQKHGMLATIFFVSFLAQKNTCPERETTVLSDDDNDSSQISSMCLACMNIFHSHSDPRR